MSIATISQIQHESLPKISAARNIISKEIWKQQFLPLSLGVKVRLQLCRLGSLASSYGHFLFLLKCYKSCKRPEQSSRPNQSQSGNQGNSSPEEAPPAASPGPGQAEGGNESGQSPEAIGNRSPLLQLLKARPSTQYPCPGKGGSSCS